MSVKFLEEAEIFEILNNAEPQKTVTEPPRCETCEQLLVPKLRNGRLINECPRCEASPE